jgi:hypothetical protein
MDLALRPMSTSQVLDRTFHIYRNNFVLLAGIGALLPAMLLIMQLCFIPLGYPVRPNANPPQSPGNLAVVLLIFFFCFGVVYLLGGALTGGATVVGVSKLHLGQSVTIRQAYKQILSRFWRVLGVIMLLGLIVFGSIVVGEIIAILVFGFSSGAFLGSARGGFGIRMFFGVLWAAMVFFSAIAGALFLYSKFALAIPACILEQLPVGASLRRSWYLTQGSVWRILIVNLLTWVLSAVLALALGAPGQIGSLMLHGKAALVGLVLQQIGGFVAGVIANPIATIAIALIYYDQRVRKEAFDLQLMMEAVGQQSQMQAAAAAPPPALG